MSVYDCHDCKDTGEYRLEEENFERLCDCSTGKALRERCRQDDEKTRARYKADREFADDMMSMPSHPNDCRGALEWMCCNNVVDVPGSYCEKCEKERFQ